MTTKIARCWLGAVVEACLELSYRQAVKYVSPGLVIKCTRQRRPDRREQGDTLLLTIGPPNYYERRFIKLCQKAGEPFPVRKVQLKAYPRK
jgi:hypothetical protein